ncbi:MAG: hypothetical protein WCT99_02565 [Bacteroidota bacterium]
MNSTYKIKEGIWYNNKGLKRKVWITFEEHISLFQRINSLTNDEHCKKILYSVWFEVDLNTTGVKCGRYESISLAETEVEKIVNQKIQWQFHG